VNAAPGLALEGSSRDEHSILLQTFVNYGRKKFYNICLAASVLQPVQTLPMTT